MRPPEQILVWLPNWLGDVAMCTPALRALDRRFPGGAMTAAGRPAACELLSGLPWFAGFIELPPKPGFREMRRVARSVRPQARDVSVLFPHSFRVALAAWLAGSIRRVGYARNGRSLLLTDTVFPDREHGRIQPVYMAQEYLDLVVQTLGCKDDGKGLELAVEPDAAQLVEDTLGPSRPRVGLAPGGAFGPAKRWLPERFARVADALTEQAGAHCVLLTGPGEEAIARAVQEAAKHRLTVLDAPWPSVRMLKAAVALLDLMVCNDSGPRHIAVAFGVPTVCIMGATSPLYSHGPYERGAVVRVDVPCGPCQQPVCETHDLRCMTEVTVERVIETAHDVLRKYGKRR